VVLPELDAQLGRREEGLWTLRPDPEGPIETVTHGLRKELAAAHRALESVRLDLAERRATEELCVLYVAMTRARHRLDLIVESPGARRSGLSYASILRAALAPSAAADEVEIWRHAENDTPWFRPELARPIEPEGAPKAKIPLRFAPPKRPRSLPSFTPSRAKDVGPIRTSRLLRPLAAITARGRILHRLLQEVEWIETFDRSDEDLVAIGRREEPDEAAVRAGVEEFRALLAHPRARESLAKPGEDAHVRREQRFAFVSTADGVESMWTGAFDRVVLRKDSAEILDFKTDRVVDAETYRPQMEAYRRALARTTGLAETAIATTLLFVGGSSVERVSL
jgi:ATP-dependent exoDNAse (exonuclease V) beta subunit